MATTAPYKQRNMQDRRAVLETDFSHGMMASNSLVDEGYVKTLVNFTFEKETGSLIPRPALRPYQMIMPDMSLNRPDDSLWFSDSVSIKDVKECVENGVTYYQIILGMLDEHDVGHLAIVTTEKTDAISTVNLTDDYAYGIKYGSSVCTFVDENVLFYSSRVPQIHDIFLVNDPSKRMDFPVGSFAYGNSYYFFTEDEGVTQLCHTVFDDTLIPPRYKYEVVAPKELNVSEAVAYGYNMLLGSQAYVFNNENTAPANNPQLKGILPYAADGHTLMMTPKQNQTVRFKCYYDINTADSYDVVWEWRETTSADWTQIQKDSVNFSTTPDLECQFIPPAKDLMVRVVLYESGTDDVVKAIVVGFDFSASNYGTAKQLEQKVYDLSTATGMERWKGRLVLWGITADPTILFMSDYEEPSYFPYPNNIVTFDEPIIYAIEFMDTLCVFTTDKLYQVTLSDDGNTWKSTVIQSHLSINPWDKHLVQTVRNMLYFKSGNYYYMMVPKAQSLTGELTLAPITTPITGFFDNFSVNVQTILEETYSYIGTYELLSYYNYLDYEDIHNIYLYKFDNTEALLHFDVIYNTVDRTWKVWVYESAHILYPFKHNATESGLLAATSLIQANNSTDPGDTKPCRIIQVFIWDKLLVRGSYLPNNTELFYDPVQDSAETSGDVLVVSGTMAYVDENGVVVFGDEYADAYGSLVTIIGATGYYSGFSVGDVSKVLADVYQDSTRYFTFRNYQFLDTGYRRDELQAKKRYREIQFLIDNLDKHDMEFGMEYLLDGAPSKIYYKYDVTQIIDEFDPDYCYAIIDSTPYLKVELDNIDNTNQWTIDQSINPEITLWKIRIAVSGKGTAPRLKLHSKNEKRFGLLSLNWISRIMHMR